MVSSKVKYQIHLLSGKNVVMITAKGYETEIFVPHISNGRITFTNVIPNRRCCQQKDKSNDEDAGLLNFKEPLTPIVRSSSRMGRFSAGESVKQNSKMQVIPLAMSTPASESNSRFKSGAIRRMSSTMEGISTLETPDLVRRAPLQHRNLNDYNSTSGLSRGLRIKQWNVNGRLDSSSRNISAAATQHEPQDLTKITDFSHALINSTPLGAFYNPRPVDTSTPINKGITSSHELLASAKWRKCKTPKRTYSRRGNHKVPKHDKSLTQDIRKIKPSFLVNPTQAPKATHSVELIKNNLKIDKKLKIPSKIMKRRQLKNNKLSTTVTGKLQLQKSLKHTKTSMTAFDMLTNSCHASTMSTKLNEQFRRGCVNKASATNPKYRVLSRMPALQKDEQILEITRTEGKNCRKSVDQIEVDNSKRADTQQFGRGIKSVPLRHKLDEVGDISRDDSKMLFPKKTSQSIPLRRKSNEEVKRLTATNSLFLERERLEAGAIKISPAKTLPKKSKKLNKKPYSRPEYSCS